MQDRLKHLGGDVNSNNTAAGTENEGNTTTVWCSRNHTVMQCLGPVKVYFHSYYLRCVKKKCHISERVYKSCRGTVKDTWVQYI